MVQASQLEDSSLKQIGNMKEELDSNTKEEIDEDFLATGRTN